MIKSLRTVGSKIYELVNQEGKPAYTLDVHMGGIIASNRQEYFGHYNVCLAVKWVI